MTLIPLFYYSIIIIKGDMYIKDKKVFVRLAWVELSLCNTAGKYFESAHSMNNYNY